MALLSTSLKEHSKIYNYNISVMLSHDGPRNYINIYHLDMKYTYSDYLP